MGLLRIGKSEHEHGHDKLNRIRENLRAKGRDVSEKDAPKGYAEAAELAISAVFDDIPELIDDAFDVLEDPPSTWGHYMAMHNGKAIYEMEFGELREAIKRDLKSGKSELHVHKEMTHVLASAIYMALIDND